LLLRPIFSFDWEKLFSSQNATNSGEAQAEIPGSGRRVLGKQKPEAAFGRLPVLERNAVVLPQVSRKLRSFRERLGCFSLRSALASI
jgi:hypothetical protein